MKSTAKTLQERFGFSDPDLTTPAHDAVMMWLDTNIKEVVAGLCSKPVVTVSNTVWESPVLGNNKYIMGFVDMIVDVGVEDPWYTAVGQEMVSTRGYRFVFEVKPKIASLGEVIRQIRMYQQSFSFNAGSTVWVIVSPDDRFKTQIENQRIRFVHVPSEAL